MRNIVIIGNGISGITCARHIRKLCDDRITVISSESDHFFSRTALMYIYMGHMTYEHTKPYEDFFWEKNRIALLRKKVTSVDTEKKSLLIDDGSFIPFDVLVIASGSVTQKFDWPGQQLKGVGGLYSLQDLEAMEMLTNKIRSAVIVGGGLIGAEMAEMLHARNITVTLLVKDSVYWGSVLPAQDGKLVSQHLEKHGIDVRYGIQLQAITGDSQGRVQQVITSTGERIDCEFAGISTGVKPNIAFLKNSGIDTARGVLVNSYFETNVKDIYAIGDCAEMLQPPAGRKSIEQVWYTGRIHGETLAQTICGKRAAYAPGPWFNSAKFFDLEFQTYGLVPTKCNDAQSYFFWQHPKREKALGIIFDKENRSIEGINAYGIRLKHKLFDEWITSKRSVDYVLANLHRAMFNPEFAKDHCNEIINRFNEEMGTSIKQMKSVKTFFKFRS